MLHFLRTAGAWAALFACAISALPVVSLAADTAIDGTVVDAQSGLPLAKSTVLLAGHADHTQTDARGHFHLELAAPGVYVVRVMHAGYQTADTSDIVVAPASSAAVTIALASAPTQSALSVIGRSGTHAAGALQTSSTISRTLAPESLVQTGVFRAGDALRALPEIQNGLTGDTAALSDDINLSFRGIGTLEALATIDGHPIAYGFPGGFNYQVSPLAALRAVGVTYGSGVNLSGNEAIGGTVDMQTLDPTYDRRFSFSQGTGTFSKAATALRATGTVGRLGYAFAYGVDSSDGPINNQYNYQPSAAFDQSTLLPGADPAVRALGFYKADSLAVARTGLAKLRYELSPISSLTFTSLTDWKYNDKTGNGDADYLAYAPALAFGQELLAKYKPANYPTLPVCPTGTFVATNANGKPNGFGPNGQPDGGLTCQTPAQYASFNTGYQGVGTRWQSFGLGDEHLTYDIAPEGLDIRLDAFANHYSQFSDRLGQLPFNSVPGDTSADSLKYSNVAEGGASLTVTRLGENNDAGIGFTYLNSAYDIATDTPTSATLGAPTAYETGFLLRDIYHPHRSPLTTYLTANLKHASATSSSYVDPRASLVYKISAHDILRFGTGATTTQPAGNQLNVPFSESPPGGGGGGAAINCGGINTIGNAPSTVLKPERGVDEELAYGHSFGADSYTQATLYSTNVYDKLYSTTVPLATVGTGFIDPAYLASVEAQVSSKCGIPDVATLLGVKGTVNVGQLRARGVMLTGRQRVNRSTFVDYDYSIDSTTIVSIPTAVLKSNLTLIPGAQLPNIPIQTLMFAVDHSFSRGFEARYTLNASAANNSKNLPAYNYSTLRFDTPAGAGRLTFTVDNLFNQYADIRGYIDEGVPLALNQYATAASYAPYIGASSTEHFGLPYRALYVNYTLSTR